MITSLHSPHIARMKALFATHSSKDRQALGAFAIEGVRAVEAARDSGHLVITEIFAIEALLESFPEATLVSEPVMKKMSDTQSPQGVIALAKLNEREPVLSSLAELGNVAYFFEIQDPGNAGTVIRSAAAFGFDAVIFSPGSVDPYSGKAVRSSVGSIAQVRLIVDFTISELTTYLLASHQLALMNMDGKDLQLIENEKPVALIFGNEARGLPAKVLEDARFSPYAIPMPGKVESLNLATAAGIAMYEISRLAMVRESRL